MTWGVVVNAMSAHTFVTREQADTFTDEHRAQGTTCVQYLGLAIVDRKRTDAPRYGMTRAGYSVRAGAPTGIMIKLEGETRWRRLMVWQFSNAGTAFVRIKGRPYVVTAL